MIALGSWGGIVIANFVVLIAYASRPGQAAPRCDWPAESRLQRVAGAPTLILFLHPRCPCSEATLSELARALVGYHGAAAVHILFTTPCNAGDDWLATGLVQQAAVIPQSDVRIDRGGVEAARFGAHVSGQVLVFDAEGRCLFDGGITPSRGHEGDTAGRDFITDIFLNQASPSEALRTPVFGCALYRPAAAARQDRSNP